MRSKRIILLAAAAFSALSVSGCSVFNFGRPVQNTKSTEMGERAGDLLSQSAVRVVTAQENLARIQSARTLPVEGSLNEELAGVPDELRRPTTIEWSGPGDSPVERVATIVGYSFAVVGNPPATLPMVSVSMHDAPAIKVLENIGLQVQPFAQVYVDVPRRRIEYRYFDAGMTTSAATNGAQMSK